MTKSGMKITNSCFKNALNENTMTLKVSKFKFEYKVFILIVQVTWNYFIFVFVRVILTTNNRRCVKSGKISSLSFTFFVFEFKISY